MDLVVDTLRDRAAVVPRSLRLHDRAGLGEVGALLVWSSRMPELTGTGQGHLLRRFRAAPDIAPKPER